jgi:hypothetical protein
MSTADTTSEMSVASTQREPTLPELAELLEDSPPIDRTSVNSWEDTDFVAAALGSPPSKRSASRQDISAADWQGQADQRRQTNRTEGDPP